MISLDSNKIAIPFSTTEGFLPESFMKQQTTVGEYVGEKYVFNRDIANRFGLYIPPGLKSIIVEPEKDMVTIETSAKVLGERYLSGINLNTIHHFVDAINSPGVIELKPGSIDSAKLLRGDITDNVKWTESRPHDLFAAIDLQITDPRYNCDIKDTAKNSGITVIGNQKTTKNRFILYHKLTEMEAKKVNRDFVKGLNVDPRDFIGQFKNVLRVEQNIAEFKTMRDRLKVLSNSLLAVMNSQVKPNYEYLKKITANDNIEQMSLFTDYEPGMKLQDVVREEGMKGIVIKCDYDLKKVKAFLKYITAGDTSAFSRAMYGHKKSGFEGFKSYLERMTAGNIKTGSQGKFDGLLNTFLHKLKEAA